VMLDRELRERIKWNRLILTDIAEHGADDTDSSVCSQFVLHAMASVTCLVCRL